MICQFCGRLLHLPDSSASTKSMNVMNTGRFGSLVPDSVLLFALWMMGMVVRMPVRTVATFRVTWISNVLHTVSVAGIFVRAILVSALRTLEFSLCVELAVGVDNSCFVFQCSAWVCPPCEWCLAINAMCDPMQASTVTTKTCAASIISVIGMQLSQQGTPAWWFCNT